MKEIERKWIVPLTKTVEKILIKNGGVEIKDHYFNQKCRLRYYGDKWFITIKSSGTLVRDEYEFEIKEPLNLDISPWLIKKRVQYEYKKQVFDLNLFKDIKINGVELITAEIELSSAKEKISIPKFFSTEVTKDKRFYGYNLFKLLK